MTTLAFETASGTGDMELTGEGAGGGLILRRGYRDTMPTSCNYIVRLNSMHSLGPGTLLLERVGSLHVSGVARGEELQAGVSVLVA